MLDRRDVVMLAGACLVLALAACTSKLVCGPGTREQNGQCVPDLTPAVMPASASAAVAPAPPPPPPAAAQPTEDDLLAVFARELMSYGINQISDQVNTAPRELSAKRFKRRGPRLFQSDTTWRNPFGAKIPVRNTVTVTGVRIEKGDTETYPHEGIVAWRCTGSASAYCGRPKTRETHYQFAAKSQKWRQKPRR